MIKSILFSLLLVLSVSCALQPQTALKANEKAFEEEDLYILLALYAKEEQAYDEAVSLFMTLYEKSAKKEYLYQSLESDLIGGKPKRLLQRVDSLDAEHAEDASLIRLKVVALTQLHKFKEAKVLATALVKKTHLPDDYILMSEVLVKLEQFDLALKYLESAYAKEYNEQILDRISIILYVNLSRAKDAIAYLETHTRIHGSTEQILQRLIGFYSDQNNIEGLLHSYKRLYSINKDEQIAKKIVQIYAYKRDYLHLIDFLESSRSDDRQLLELYISSKNYKKAYPLAEELYRSRSEIEYLGQSAIFEYESAKDKNDTKLLKSVVDKLQRVAQKDSSPIYLNYLGYLLIDHEIDVKKGIAYIKRVLELEPDSAYYLDSLAWGYYKLGECKKADTIIQRVLKLKGGDNIEVIEHAKAIKKCLKNKKGKK